HGHWPRDCGLCGVTLLGLSIATLSTVTHYGLHFTLISNISLESNSYRVIHHAAFYFGICLSMTLILAALLSSAATVRESQCLTAMVRVGRAWLGGAFCNLGLVPLKCGAGVFRVYRSLLSSQVEDSMMDVYDLVYEEVRRNTSSFRRHELTAIHEAVTLLGGQSPPQAAAMLQGVSVSSQDCLREIHDFLKKHMDFVSTLLGVTIGFMVYGMILTSFLWFSIHFSSNLDRKGRYVLRESSWRWKMSEVPHKIPQEGVAWGQVVGHVSHASPSCTMRFRAFPSWSEQTMLCGGAVPHLHQNQTRAETCTWARRCRSPCRGTYGL
uniref:Tetraspanin 32 n=1 Tax=Aquila chrysaetos chrysaetos TaxID=223781 RepID=A0A663EV60_AQUCH